MDIFTKKLLKEFDQMQQQTGRMMRSMSISRMMYADNGQWQPAIDMYEAENEIVIFVEVAGVALENLSVSIDDNQLLLIGKRELVTREAIACIHQLEIEQGAFKRKIQLPCAVDVEQIKSTYKNGILLIALPKQGKQDVVNIEISPGE